MCQNFKQNLLSVLSTSLTSVEEVVAILDPTWSGLPQFKTDVQAAITAITNWQEGTPAQNVVQILDILIADVNLFPVSPQYQAVIVIALNGIKSVIVLIEEHSTGATQAAAQSVTERTANATVNGRKVDAWVPPTKVYEGTREYALDWNKEVKKHPNLVHATVPVPKKWHVLP